ARARHPRAPGSRRHAARPPHARRRGPAPRLGAPLRARRPASAGGGGGARRRARHLPAGAPALAGLAGAARAAGGRAPPGAPAAPLPEGVALGGGPTVGMVGHLDARKNPAVLVEAMAEVRAAVPGARALLVGAFRDPAYERSVRERARALGLADAVAVTGFL